MAGRFSCDLFPGNDYPKHTELLTCNDPWLGLLRNWPFCIRCSLGDSGRGNLHVAKHKPPICETGNGIVDRSCIFAAFRDRYAVWDLGLDYTIPFTSDVAGSRL